ncbi:Rid family hydrolase [Luteimonas sp. RD2P54]|uniref:Rid family hydrolase n=1 Tax=Luteimonas endophytica TaxID=3042023 RepID=A0ABT6JAK8_9GAMM|nr:Rid family hydrolase [Luteimonas endophytica]MDH5823627.1 Rid family hydrolase [Luteimonas endophytica]
MRVNISSGAPLESRIGFSRAVRIGNLLAVAGTAPVSPDGSVAAPGDVRGQTRRCLQIIAAALAAAGLEMSGVIRIRILLTDIDTWREAAKAYREFFPPGNRPACTFVEVRRFIDRRWLVEVEADGVFADDPAPSGPEPGERHPVRRTERAEAA